VVAKRHVFELQAFRDEQISRTKSPGFTRNKDRRTNQDTSYNQYSANKSLWITPCLVAADGENQQKTTFSVVESFISNHQQSYVKMG
jgi:hypothetical protein